MKINVQHVAIAVAIAGLAFYVGKRRASLVKQSTADQNIQSSAQWWNYAGLWSQ